jgi:hypothetical protein
MAMSENDTIERGCETEPLFGGNGDDELFAGAGDDHLWAGLGDDICFVEGGFDNDVIEAGMCSAEITGIRSTHIVAAEAQGSSVGSAIRGGDMDAFYLVSDSNDAVFEYDRHDSLFDGDGDGDDMIWTGEIGRVRGRDGDALFLIASIMDQKTDETPGNSRGFLGLSQWDILTFGNTRLSIAEGVSGNAGLNAGSAFNFSETEDVIVSISSAIRIVAPQVMSEAQDLQLGDMVITRDHGLQPVSWGGWRNISAHTSLAPTRF